MFFRDIDNIKPIYQFFWLETSLLILLCLGSALILQKEYQTFLETLERENREAAQKAGCIAFHELCYSWLSGVELRVHTLPVQGAAVDQKEKEESASTVGALKLPWERYLLSSAFFFVTFFIAKASFEMYFSGGDQNLSVVTLALVTCWLIFQVQKQEENALSLLCSRGPIN